MKDTIKLLRFHFSVFLLPISLFSFYFIRPELSGHLLLVIFIWHILVFPASNGYNSYQDQDEGPIGGLASPPKPTKLLFQMANAMDGLAILLSFFLNLYFVLFVTLFIVASRLYSYKGVRLKKFPILGFLVVFIFQGFWIFCANIYALSTEALFLNDSVVYAAVATSFFIATIYPLTQIYQHEADAEDGVKTLSMLLGIKGTFLFSALMFTLASVFVFLSFNALNALSNFWLFNIVMLPSTAYFLFWGWRSFKNVRKVNFKNTMVMLVLSSLLNNVFFLILLLK